jgi:hypothetical protein
LKPTIISKRKKSVQKIKLNEKETKITNKK